MKRESIHSVVRLVILFAFVVMPWAASAQDAPATPQDKPAEPPEERPTGLPSKMKWTFNFDAGWGTFGFANSLYDNPKEPGVDENLSDQWFEGYMKPALCSELHARVFERSLRQDQRGRRTDLRVDAGRLRAGRLVVRARGSVDWVAVGKRIRGARRERAGCRRGPDAVPAGSWLPALRRSGRRRQPGRLLDERAQGVRARRDRPLQARRTYGRSVLSRQGRARGERHRQPAVGRQLRVRDSASTRRSAPPT